MAKQDSRKDSGITAGAVITKAGSSMKNKTGFWGVFKPVLLNSRCNACGICVQYCPDGCIVIKDTKASINQDYCKGCAICSKECPSKAIIMQKKILKSC